MQVRQANENGLSVQVYVQINQEAEANPAIHDEARAFFKLMEDGDEESLGLWNRFRDFSIKKLEKTYARLNIHFDIYGGESVVKPESMEEAVDILEKKGLLCEEKGGVLVDLTKYKLDKAVVRKNGERSPWRKVASHLRLIWILRSQTGPAST